MIVRQLHAPDLPQLESLRRLLRQLTDRELPSVDELRQVCNSPVNYVYIASEGELIIGTATLHQIESLTGCFGVIENVVVDGEFTGQGIATRLIRALMQLGRRLELDYLELTSRPERQVAHRLYRSAGFTQRDTCVFRYTFPPL